MTSKLVCLFFTLLLITAIQAQKFKQLTILHTNDMHSRIDPMPLNDERNPDQGGFVRQATFIESVRKNHPVVLLLNSGDNVQGTPYYNIFKGEVEIKCMNEMKYDAVCLGNHEFDNGLESMVSMIRQAKFPFIISNYDLSETALKGLTKQYLIIKRNGLKIGIIGIGINPEGLISPKNRIGLKYLPPVETANQLASLLKEKRKCDLVVCLSHLGYFSSGDKPNDQILAQKSRNIDIILGGHTHSLLQQPDRILNRDGKEVVVAQAGKNAFHVGQVDVSFKKN